MSASMERICIGLSKCKKIKKCVRGARSPCNGNHFLVIEVLATSILYSFFAYSRMFKHLKHRRSFYVIYVIVYVMRYSVYLFTLFKLFIRSYKYDILKLIVVFVLLLSQHFGDADVIRKHTMSEEDSVASTGSTLAGVSVKLPPFWSADPEVWFVQVEAQFSTKGILSQKTKYDYVISSLTPEFAMEVRDLLLNPPADNPYDTLKAQLIKRNTASEQRKLQQLISGEELGDRKPTQLLRRMQQPLGDKLGSSSDTNSFLREFFLQRLPANVRMVLASMDMSMDISKLADMADKVMEVATPTASAISDTSFERVEAGEMKKASGRCCPVNRLSSIFTNRSETKSLQVSSCSQSSSLERPSCPQSSSPERFYLRLTLLVSH